MIESKYKKIYENTKLRKERLVFAFSMFLLTREADREKSWILEKVRTGWAKNMELSFRYVLNFSPFLPSRSRERIGARGYWVMLKVYRVSTSCTALMSNPGRHYLSYGVSFWCHIHFVTLSAGVSLWCHILFVTPSISLVVFYIIRGGGLI